MPEQTNTQDVVQLPRIVNLCRKRADTFPFTMTFTDAVSGTPLDLTGGTVVLTVNSLLEPPETTPPSATQLFQTTGVLGVPPTNGQVTFTLSTGDADQSPNTYFYDVQLTDAGGAIRTLAQGEWIVEQDITK